MKKNVSGVGICGCLTSLVWKHNRENGSFWGVSLAVLGLWWGPRGPWMGKSPLPDVDEYAEEKCCWCGYLWLHDITLIVWKQHRENGSVWGVCLAVLGLWLGPLRALDGQITPTRCGWVNYMMKNVAGVGICGCITSLCIWWVIHHHPKSLKNLFSPSKNLTSTTGPVGLLDSQKGTVRPYYSHGARRFCKSYNSFKDGVSLCLLFRYC